MTTKEAAAYLGMDHRTVRGWIQRGILPIARRITPRLTLVSRTEIEKLKATPPRSGPKPTRKDQP